MSADPADRPLAILPHVLYEIRHAMLIPQWDDADELLMEAVFLSFMVHARVLIGFFEPKPEAPRPDDVFCTDFFGFKARELRIPDDDKLRFGKDMMHLTYKRLRHTPKTKTKTWPVLPVYRALKPACLEFAAFVLQASNYPISYQELAQWCETHDLLSSTADSMIVVPSKGTAP